MTQKEKRLNLASRLASFIATNILVFMFGMFIGNLLGSLNETKKVKTDYAKTAREVDSLSAVVDSILIDYHNRKDSCEVGSENY